MASKPQRLNEKEGSNGKIKVRELNRIGTYSHCRKGLQRTTLNSFEFYGFVLTSVLTKPTFHHAAGVFTYERGGGGNRTRE
jgi:hypothetical protein